MQDKWQRGKGNYVLPWSLISFHSLFILLVIERIEMVQMQILPDGTTWIPNLMQTIIDVMTNGGESITIDQKLIDGPNPNSKGKFFIPLVLAFQVSINFSPFYLYLHLEMILKDDIHPFLLASILFCSQRDTKSDKEWCCKREHATLGATRYGLGRPQVLISEANWRRHFAFVSPFLSQPCFFSCLLLSLLTIAFFKFRVYRSGDRQSSWARCIGA